MTTYPYLGPAGGLLQLPGPTGDITISSSRGETIHALLSGGVAKTQRIDRKRSWELPYTSLPGSGTAELLDDLYDGVYSDDLVFVHPDYRNMLTVDASQFGLRTAADLGWTASAGTLTRSATGGPQCVRTGVVVWSSLAAGAALQPGDSASVADTDTAPAYLPSEPVAVSLYLKASAATTVTLRCAGYQADGTLLGSVNQSIALTTAWRRYTTAVAANDATLAGSLYVLPRLVLGGSVPTSVSVAAAQLEYGGGASVWQRGYGAPRVMVTADPGRTVQKYDGYSDHTLTLAET